MGYNKMTFDPFTAAIEAGTSIINKIWPDAESREKRIAEMHKIAATGDLAELQGHITLMLAQAEINKVEASHPNIFVSGWRPMIGWTCGIAIAWATLIHPMLTWVWAFANMAGEPPPVLETSALVALVSSMLGVAGMRSHDKAKGVDTKRHG